MKGNSRVTAHLQRLIKTLLGVVDITLLHARIYEDRGLAKLSEHADGTLQAARDGLNRLLRRVLFLGTTPDISQRHSFSTASNVPDMLRKELDAQYRLNEQLRTAIACCHEENDYQTGALLGTILAEVEE
ncbi:MAG: hypothetical protein N838_22345, partial [Thiohalocapsa sp. PB-PSB1]